jgi:hypothetical protein
MVGGRPQSPVSQREAAIPGGTDVLSGWVHWDGTSSALYNHLAGQAYHYLEMRRTAVAKLHTAEQWLERRDMIRHTLG